MHGCRRRRWVGEWVLHLLMGLTCRVVKPPTVLTGGMRGWAEFPWWVLW